MARRKQWLTSERKTKFALAISAAMLLVTASGTTVDKWIAVSEFLDRREVALRQRLNEISRQLDEVAGKVAAVRVK